VRRFLKRWRDRLLAPTHDILLQRLLNRNRRMDTETLPERRGLRLYTDEEIRRMPHASTLLGGCRFTKRTAEADAVVVWNPGYYFNRWKLLWRALLAGKPLLIAEDGPLRSIDIGARGDPGLSCILDDLGVYFDPFSSRIRVFLESNWELTEEERGRVRHLMEKIQRYRLSKYNLVPPHPPLSPKTGRRVLVIDQRRGDRSVVLSGLNEERFRQMLEDAVAENPDAEIWIKTHPDANSGLFDGYYVGYHPESERIRKITDNVNPLCLIEAVDRVYVGSSQMGFEALMAGREVVCYGMPFYAGWGVTVDRGGDRGCRRRRNVEELFYALYLRYTRYCNPRSGEECSLDEFIELLHQETGWSDD
jgi:capsular polysaccharide export protein